MLTLKQYTGSMVTPTDDALLYEFIIGKKSGIISGCQVTHLGGNQISIASGRGLIQGRVFVVEQETVLATVSPNGTVDGRLLLRVDMANAETPIAFATQAHTPLPDLVQENINQDGEVYELPMATYQINEISLSGLQVVSPILIPHVYSPLHTYPVTAALTPSGVLELTGEGLPADKDGLTVQFVSPAAATDGLQMKFAGSDTLYPILTTGEGKEPIQAGAWGQGVPVTLTVSGGSCFFKAGGQGFPPGWNEKGQGIAWDDITKNSPIVQREYGKIEDGLQALPGPDVLPTGNGVGCAFSPDNNYLAVGHARSPNVAIYKRDGDTFTKLPTPSTLPAGNGRGCAFSPDNNYLAISHEDNPYITIYKRNGDTFTKLPNPSALPTGSAEGCAFSPDNNYLAVSYSASPYITIYKRNGDTFTKLPNPATLPTGNGYCCAFSPDGIYLAVGHSSEPYLTIYKRSGNTFTKLSNPNYLPPSPGTGCAFSADTNYLAVTVINWPYVVIYKRNGDQFILLENPSELPAGGGNECVFSPDGNYLVVAHSATPYVIIYKHSGDIFDKMPIPEVIPTGNGQGCAFSPNAGYLAVAHYNSPYITIYLNEQKTYIHTLNEINKEYFAYAPKGKIGVAKESKAAGETVKATLFPALYNLTNQGEG